MKYLILIYSLFAFNSAIGQTLTQKYNSFLNRYEFYNSSNILIGYKEYNKFLNQWEYFSSEETAQNSYIDPIDHEDMERTMSKLQNNYDNNARIVNNRLSEVGGMVDELIKDKEFIKSKYSEPVLKILQNLQSILKKLENENIDFSKKSTGQYYLNLIQPYYNQLKYYKTNFEAEQTQISFIDSASKVDLRDNPVPDRLFGGYETDNIEEYQLDPKTKEYILIKTIELHSKVYFDIIGYSFQRGNNAWLYNKWSYSEYDSKNKSFIYFDSYGSTLAISDDFKSIAWFMSRNSDGNFEKIIRYTNLKPNRLIKPE